MKKKREILSESDKAMIQCLSRFAEHGRKLRIAQQTGKSVEVVEQELEQQAEDNRKKSLELQQELENYKRQREYCYEKAEFICYGFGGGIKLCDKHAKRLKGFAWGNDKYINLVPIENEDVICEHAR